MPTLRDATLAIERGVNGALGDEITYTVAGSDPVTFDTWVEFGTALINPGRSTASMEKVTVEVPTDLVPEPASTDRITVALLPGKTWEMASRERGPTGMVWILDLKRAVA